MTSVSATPAAAGPKLTKFQKRVMAIVKALGPMSCKEIAFHCIQPRRAVLKTLWRLRQVDLVVRSGDGYSSKSPDA